MYTVPNKFPCLLFDIVAIGIKVGIAVVGIVVEQNLVGIAVIGISPVGINARTP
jgi:hypothetical protein